MPYFISNEQADCAGWATIKIDDDGSIETVGCHETMNEAVAQMVAISLDEGIEPGGEYESNGATRQEDNRAMRRGELNNVREVRQYAISDIELREGSDAGTIRFVGYATVFNHDYVVHDAYGSFTERITPEAFNRTLSEQPDVILNLNHGMAGTGLPMARTPRPNRPGTLQLTPDKVGLRVETDLALDDPDVQAILPKMRRGDLDEMSFAFRVPEAGSTWQPGPDGEPFGDRTITEVNMARGDVSIVSYGANPATVAALRAALADEDVRAELLGEERVLTTEDVDPEPETDEDIIEAIEVIDADPEPVADDEERGWKGIVPTMTYYQSLLVDRRQSA
jgi:HK97 family phage prohead protease